MTLPLTSHEMGLIQKLHQKSYTKNEADLITYAELWQGLYNYSKQTSSMLGTPSFEYVLDDIVRDITSKTAKQAVWESVAMMVGQMYQEDTECIKACSDYLHRHGKDCPEKLTYSIGYAAWFLPQGHVATEFIPESLESCVYGSLSQDHNDSYVKMMRTLKQITDVNPYDSSLTWLYAIKYLMGRKNSINESDITFATCWPIKSPESVVPLLQGDTTPAFKVMVLAALQQHMGPFDYVEMVQTFSQNMDLTTPLTCRAWAAKMMLDHASKSSMRKILGVEEVLGELLPDHIHGIKALCIEKHEISRYVDDLIHNTQATTPQLELPHEFSHDASL